MYSFFKNYSQENGKTCMRQSVTYNLSSIELLIAPFLIKQLELQLRLFSFLINWTIIFMIK